MEYYVHVDSRDRVSGSQTAFTIRLPEQIRATRVELVSVELPLTMYTIAPGTNQLLFSEFGTPAVATVPSGNYSIPDLCVALGNAMSAVSPGGATYTVSYNATTDLVTIGTTANYALRNADAASQSQWLFELLGFTATNTTAFTAHTGTNSPNFGPPNYLYLNIAGLGGNNYSSNPQNSRGMLAKLVLTGNTFAISRYEEDKYGVNATQGNPFIMSDLVIDISSYNRRPVTMRSDWSLTLRCIDC